MEYRNKGRYIGCIVYTIIKIYACCYAHEMQFIQRIGGILRGEKWWKPWYMVGAHLGNR